MKKLYLLLAASVLICGTMSAQLTRADLMSSKAKLTTSKINLKAQKPNTQKDDEIIWSCDFEDETAYTIISPSEGADSSVTVWRPVTEETYPSINGGQNVGGFYVLPLNCNYEWAPNHWNLSETPATWMIFNAFDHYAQPGFSGDGVWGPMESSIVFSNIDLSECEAPKVTLIQHYEVFNAPGDTMTISTSTDGGATWNIHEVNTASDLGTSDEATGLLEVLIPEVGGESNVSVKITYKNCPIYQNDSYAGQVGWQIDDVKIVPAPAHNLTINEGRISMFGYIDYRNVPESYWTNLSAAEKRDYAYQYYDPYAQSPKAQWESGYGFAAFNVEYTNNGALSATPKVNIVVTSPSGVELYDTTFVGGALAMTERDTLDFADIDSETPAVFYFNEGDEIELGRYDVTFTIWEDDIEDEDSTDNTFTQYFYITDGVYSKSYDEPTSTFYANAYTNSAPGDMFGSEFLYFYAPEKRMSVDLYIGERTTPGVQVKVGLYHYDDEGEPYLVRESDFVEIDSTMIDSWNTFEFTNEYGFVFEEDEQYRTVLVMACAAWDNDNDRVIYGSSDKLSTRGHNSIKYLTAADSWYYGNDDIALNFFEAGEIYVNETFADGIEMYPNPSTGIVNFSNVENATIEIYNMMGQVVASMSDASENASIDLSGVANGNYVVRIVKDGAIATSKLNIVK